MIVFVRNPCAPAAMYRETSIISFAARDNVRDGFDRA